MQLYSLDITERKRRFLFLNIILGALCFWAPSWLQEPMLGLPELKPEGAAQTFLKGWVAQGALAQTVSFWGMF